MDEDEFKKTYSEFNDRPCVFAKALLRHCAGCSRSQKVLIAERESMACHSPDGHEQCQKLATELRQNALFALKLTHLEGQLPHGKEMKVQCGGLLGLEHETHGQASDRVFDVYGLLHAALEKFGSIEKLPYSRIAQFIVHFKPRGR